MRTGQSWQGGRGPGHYGIGPWHLLSGGAPGPAGLRGEAAARGRGAAAGSGQGPRGCTGELAVGQAGSARVGHGHPPPPTHGFGRAGRRKWHWWGGLGLRVRGALGKRGAGASRGGWHGWGTGGLQYGQGRAGPAAAQGPGRGGAPGGETGRGVRGRCGHWWDRGRHVAGTLRIAGQAAVRGKGRHAGHCGRQRGREGYEGAGGTAGVGGGRQGVAPGTTGRRRPCLRAGTGRRRAGRMMGTAGRPRGMVAMGQGAFGWCLAGPRRAGAAGRYVVGLRGTGGCRRGTWHAGARAGVAQGTAWGPCGLGRVS